MELVDQKLLNNVIAKVHTESKNISKTDDHCPCAVKIQTKKKVADYVASGVNVYSIESKKGKSISFKKCVRPLYDGQCFCYKHYETSLSNKSNLVLWENIIKTGKKNIGDPNNTSKTDIILLFDRNIISKLLEIKKIMDKEDSDEGESDAEESDAEESGEEESDAEESGEEESDAEESGEEESDAE